MPVPNAVQQTSDLRVHKARAEATLTLSNGASMHGFLFTSGNSRTHVGPEGVKDVLNAETGFFPFEVDAAQGTKTIMLNRDHVVYLQLTDRGEARRDSGYDVAKERTVTMLLSNGARLSGAVRVFRPQSSDRLSDFARADEMFRYLESENATYIVNIRHVLELAEETPGL